VNLFETTGDVHNTPSSADNLLLTHIVVQDDSIDRTLRQWSSFPNAGTLWCTHCHNPRVGLELAFELTYQANTPPTVHHSAPGWGINATSLQPTAGADKLWRLLSTEGIVTLMPNSGIDLASFYSMPLCHSLKASALPTELNPFPFLSASLPAFLPLMAGEPLPLPLGRGFTPINFHKFYNAAGELWCFLEVIKQASCNGFVEM
jgi:hypothetical protein